MKNNNFVNFFNNMKNNAKIARDNNKCPICKKNINVDEFVDDISIREFKISGLCQKCQDKMFK